MHSPTDISSDALERRLFELATDALVVCDTSGAVRAANPAAGRLAGRPPEELCGAWAWDLVAAQDRDRIRAFFAACVAGELPPGDEFRVRVERPGGETRWAEVRSTVDVAAGLCHFVARDITERDEEDAERFGQAFRDAPTGMALVNPDGTVRRVNAALAALLGRPADELVGMNSVDLAASREDAERWRDRRWADGAPGSFELEARLLVGGGGVAVALVSGTLVRDAAGDPLYYLCQFQDVTARIATQEALAANEAQLAEAQQVARLGSWEWVIGDNRVTWSDELFRVHGLRPEPGTRTWSEHLDRVHPEDRSRLARTVEQGLLEGRAWNIDHRILRPDGDVRMIHARGEIAFAEDGSPSVVHGTCQDVTEARRVEDALRATEQLFRRAFDDAPIGMALIDLEGRWLRLNRAIAQMVGRAEADLRTRTLASLSHPDDEDLDGPLVRELLAGRRRSYAIEKRMMHADGRVLHVLAHISLMHGDGERPLYFLVQLIDLSERRRAEAERRAGEQRLQAIVDNAPALIFVKDARQRYLLVNRRWEELMGVTAEAAVGHSAAEVLPPRLAVSSEDELEREVVHSGEMRESQIAIPGPDGAPAREFHLIKFPLLDSEGTVSGVCTIATDVTERQRAEQERGELEQRLAQAQRLESVGQLAGGVAHDFNNLLSVILSCVTFARDELEADSPVREDVEEIGRAAERAAGLTRQLLMFSRREVVRPEVLALGPLVRDLESLLSRSLGERIRLQIACAPDLPPVLADRSRVEQVLVNLAVNARDAMPSGGTLSIDLRSTTGAVEVTVADEGTGMSPEVADRAFEPFFTTKGPGDGTGLGLATVHGIVTDSGGTIELRSVEGEGTVVRFTLPAAEEGALPAEEGPRAAGPPAATGTARILVVEDQDPVRRQAVRMLEQQGYAVSEAASADDALAAWEPVDLLVTDVVMPGTSGHELARLALDRDPGLRVVFMSGHTEDVVLLDSAREREIAFVQKPFTRDSLLGAVAQALATPAGIGAAASSDAA